VDRFDGTIYANDTLDREKQSSYQIIIKASNDINYQQKNVTICTCILIISLCIVLAFITKPILLYVFQRFPTDVSVIYTLIN